MKLDAASIRDRDAWKTAGFELPAFDREAVAKATREGPEWLHFGAGNIFRSFPAAIQQRLLDAGKAKTGIVVAEGFDTEIVGKAYRPFDNLSVLVLLKADGGIEKRVIGSVVESLVAEPGSPDWARLVEAFESPSLRMASLTVTEKGYALSGSGGAFLPDIAADLAAGPGAPRSLMGRLSSLCLARYRAGALPLALVSMDNCSHNGERLHAAIHAMAEAWAKAGLADEGFVAYVDDPARLSFPWTMIDKITPRPHEAVKTMLEESGFEDTAILVTARQTWTAAFVNAEEKEYLVVEDSFPNGRPPLEAGGVLFADRATVEAVEKMKVGTCLNPLHTSLALSGCLLGYRTIFEEMRDPDLVALVERVGYVEGLPVVVDPGVISPKAFIDEVVKIRFPNPFMPDTPQRIASDTSQKLAIRFGGTIKAYLARPDLEIGELRGIAFVLAAWCRYLMGLDDEGRPFEPSPDPRLEACRAHVAGIVLGEARDFHAELAPLLSDPSLFGVDLYAAGLGTRVEALFAAMVAGKGAVRKTLREVVAR